MATKRMLTLAEARTALAAAHELAVQQGLRVAIAVVDDGGRLVCLERMDGVPFGSTDVALEKAISAAAYRRPTAVFDERLSGGRHAVLRQPFAFPIQGGLPLRVEDEFVGAIGASGALAEQDSALCAAGVAALVAAASGVRS